MGSRMTKYYDEPEVKSSRFSKNETLYKEISKSEIENFDIKSNAVILGDNKNEIDVENIKKILDTRYKDIPKRRSIRLEYEEDKREEKEDTKEYDINAVLEKAKEQKLDNYEEERFKKLRDTQFDILKNLNITKKEDNVLDEEDNKESDLKKLINTIAFNERCNKDEFDSTPLDILSDLKGSGNTEVLSGLKEEIQQEIEKTEQIEANVKASLKEDKKEDGLSMVNSFYTSSNALNKKDFEEIDDDEFKEDLEGNNAIIKVIIAFIIIIFVVGLIIFIKTKFFS